MSIPIINVTSLTPILQAAIATDQQVTIYDQQGIAYRANIVDVVSAAISGGTIAIAPVISIAYANLQADIAANSLVVGQSYLITDYQTIYDRPDYEDVAGSYVPKAVISTITAATEPIIVMATSANTLRPEAYSPSQPKDILIYDVNYTATIINATPAKGFIMRRVDTEKNIDLPFDWRSVTFKFYDHADGLGFVWYWDAGASTSSLLAPIRDLTQTFNALVENSRLINLAYTVFDLPNFSIGSIGNSNVGIMINNHCGDSFNNSKVTTCVGNVIGDEFMLNTVTGIYDTRIGNLFRNNDVGILQESVVGDEMADNKIAYIFGSIIGNSMQSVSGAAISSQDLSAATIIYQQGAKVITRSTDDAHWITYPTTLGVLTTVSITT